MNMFVSPQNFTCTCNTTPCCCPDLRQQMLALINDPASGVMQTIINNIGVLGAPIPVKGVVDGSDAGPGVVGEFIEYTTQPFAYAAYPAVTTIVAAGPVIPPGDWNLTAFLSVTTEVGGSFFYVNPLPAGLSTIMIGMLAVSSPDAVEEAFVLPGIPARGSFTVPTLLPLTATIFQNTINTLPAGTGSITVQARRAR